MTANTIRAIKELPDEYVVDGTEVYQFDEYVVAAAILLPPIFWKDGKWMPMRVDEAKPL